MPTIMARAELPKQQTSTVQPLTEPVRQPVSSGVAQVAEVPTPTEDLSPKFADLARKEKSLRAKWQEIKAKEEACKAKEAEYSSAYIPKSQLAERFQKDPLGLANEYGVSYDQIAAAALTQPDPTIQKLLKKIEDLELKQAEGVTKQEESQSQAYEQAVKQIRNEAKLLTNGNSEFEMIQNTGSEEAVVELIKSSFDETGVIMSVEEAAKEVENYLTEEAIKLAQLKKVQSKLQAPVAEKTPEIQKNPIKTLTHQQSASSPALSAKERRQRAILAFQGRT